MKFTVSRTKSGKYSGIDHNGDLYFTDDEEVVVEYEYELQDFIDFLFVHKDKYIKEVITTFLIENPGLLEELIEERYANEFAKWLDRGWELV